MDDLPQPDYSKQGSMLPMGIALSCLGLFMVGGSVLVGAVFFSSQRRLAEDAERQLQHEREAYHAEEVAAQLEHGVTLLLAGQSGDRQQLEATAEVLRERLRLSGIKGEVHVRADLKLQVKLPGDAVESVLDLLLVGGDLQFKLVANLSGEALEAALSEVADRKAAGTYDSEVDAYDVGHTREGKVVLLENPGVPGYLLTAVRAVKDGAGNPAIGFEFGEQGQARFGDLTGNNLERNLAIVLDGVVRDTPTIRSRIERSGVITNDGGFDTDVQERLITVLQSGKLPVDLDLESQTTGE